MKKVLILAMFLLAMHGYRVEAYAVCSSGNILQPGQTCASASANSYFASLEATPQTRICSGGYYWNGSGCVSLIQECLSIPNSMWGNNTCTCQSGFDMNPTISYMVYYPGQISKNFNFTCIKNSVQYVFNPNDDSYFSTPSVQSAYQIPSWYAVVSPVISSSPYQPSYSYRYVAPQADYMYSYSTYNY